MRRFAVVVHDVHPAEERAIEEIMRALTPRVGTRFTLAVVPRWHGLDQDAAWGRLWRRWKERVTDLALHGLTHRASRPGLVALLTRNANEFAHLDLRETRRSLALAQELCERTFGRTLPGLVPPAWMLPHDLRALDGLGLDYVARFRELETAHGTRSVRTRSWDWGILPGVARAGAFIGSKLSRGELHVVAIHPEDVRRGLLPAISAHIDALGRRGYVATTLGHAASLGR